MKRIIIVCTVVCALCAVLVSIGLSDSPEETFKKAFPHLPLSSLRQTEIKGVYEIVSENRVGYYAPEPGYLFIGDIIDRNGVNITANRRNELVVSKVKSLPLDKALKMGTGKHTVIEFTDPDCPYCRKASTFLSQKTDVTRYVFFLPLPMHKDAENKVRYVFCANDRTRAYEDAMQGKLDNQKYVVCKKPEVDDLLKVHKEAVTRMGVTGTPFFIVNNKPVSGANFPQIDEALREK